MTSATITWVEDMQFVAMGDSGHGVVVDASADGGGHNSGTRPMELLLMGVLACTAMDVVSILKKKRQPVQGLKIFASSERAAEHPKLFTIIHLEYVAYGEVDPVALARSISLSEEKYCSAIASMRANVQMTSSYRVEKTA